MSELHGVSPHADDALASPGSPWSHRCRLIVLRCVPYAVSAVLGLLMVIFLAIPAGMPPEIELNPASSLSSVNISASLVTAQWNIALSFKNPSKLFPVKYTHVKLQLSFENRLSLSTPSHIPTFAQGPGNVTTVRGEALSVLAIVNDLGVKGLVSALKGGVVTIDVVAKAKRRLHLGPWWVAVFDVYASCMGVTFIASANSEGRGDWMALGGTLSCTLDIFSLLCEVDAQNEKLSMLHLGVWTRSGSSGNRVIHSWTNQFIIYGALVEAGFVLLEDYLDRAQPEHDLPHLRPELLEFDGGHCHRSRRSPR